MIFGQLIILVFVYITLIFDLRVIFSKTLCVKYILPKDSFLRFFFIRKSRETDPYLSFLLIPVFTIFLLLIVFITLFILKINVSSFYWILIVETILIGCFRVFIEYLNKSYIKREEKMTKTQFDGILRQYNDHFQQ